MYKNLLTASLFTVYASSLAQVGIGTTSPHSSSILDVESTTKGFLPPRVSSDTQVNSPANGLLIYDESDNCLNVYNGTAWINLCSSDGSVTPPSSSNSNLNLDCSGVFENPLTFGQGAYATVLSSNINDEEFTFHLNADGSSLYSNYGQYYDTNSTINPRSSSGLFSSTTQVLALKQAFPDKKWKDFVVIDYFNNQYPAVVYLLSTDGTLHSMALTEYNLNPTSLDRFGMTSAYIDPNNDNQYINDPGTGQNDYRFTPINHLVDDVNTSIKFSSFYHSLTSKTPNLEYAIYTYDNVGKKFYAFGSQLSSGIIRTKSLAERLGRSTEPASLKESVILKEADKLNEVINYFGTEFTESDGYDVTFFSRYFLNRTARIYITNDGFVNIYYGSNDIYRFLLPGGVKAKSITGNYSAPILGDDGKLYRLGGNNLNTSTGGYTNSTITLATLGTVNLHEKTATAYVPAGSNINDVIFKRFYYGVGSADYHGLSTDGKLYDVVLSSTNTATDFSTPYNIPQIDEILSAHYDLVVKDINGNTFGIAHFSNLRQDLPNDMFESTALDLNGYPITDYVNNKIRLLFNCLGR